MSTAIHEAGHAVAYEWAHQCYPPWVTIKPWDVEIKEAARSEDAPVTEKDFVFRPSASALGETSVQLPSWRRRGHGRKAAIIDLAGCAAEYRFLRKKGPKIATGEDVANFMHANGGKPDHDRVFDWLLKNSFSGGEGLNSFLLGYWQETVWILGLYRESIRSIAAGLKAFGTLDSQAMQYITTDESGTPRERVRALKCKGYKPPSPYELLILQFRTEQERTGEIL